WGGPSGRLRPRTGPRWTGSPPATSSTRGRPDARLAASSGTPPPTLPATARSRPADPPPSPREREAPPPHPALRSTSRRYWATAAAGRWGLPDLRHEQDLRGRRTPDTVRRSHGCTPLVCPCGPVGHTSGPRERRRVRRNPG